MNMSLSKQNYHSKNITELLSPPRDSSAREQALGGGRKESLRKMECVGLISQTVTNAATSSVAEHTNDSATVHRKQGIQPHALKRKGGKGEERELQSLLQSM